MLGPSSRGAHLLEGRLALCVEGLVDRRHALGGDHLGDGAGDALHRLLVRLLLAARQQADGLMHARGVIEY